MIELLAKYVDTPKKSATALEENELDLVFEHFTQKNSVENFDAYFATAAEKRSRKRLRPRRRPAAPPPPRRPIRRRRRSAPVRPRARSKSPKAPAAPRPQIERRTVDTRTPAGQCGPV